MIILLSPAKRLDFSPPEASVESTEPELADQTALLAREAKGLSRADLRRLMDISDDLADLNYERFQSFDADATDGAPAVLTFAGDVYRGLDARSLGRGQLNWAQDHVRILSGLYGLLRPLDAIQPYRLEMGTRMRNSRGASLYEFWGPRIAEALNAAQKGRRDKTIVNLASQEYFRAVDTTALDAPVISPSFKQKTQSGLKIVAVYAKEARGRMTRWAIENKCAKAEALKDFDLDGYRYDAEASSETEWVFSRTPPPKKSKS